MLRSLVDGVGWKDCDARCSATADDRMMRTNLIPVADLLAGFPPPQAASS